jgi:cytochrome c peroxidase
MVLKLKVLIILLFAAFAGWVIMIRPLAVAVNAGSSSAIPAAPTGVSASNGDYSTKVGIRWDTMRDAVIYRIFRNTVNDAPSATEVGSTAANYFFDTTASQGENLFYWVRAENGLGQGGLSSTVTGLRANGSVTPGQFSPLDPLPAPSGNAVTAAKDYLGKALFWDEQLSSTRTVACGTCHRPAAGGSDPRTEAGGPAVVNPGPDSTFGTVDDIFGSPGVPKNNLDGTFSLDAVFGSDLQVTNRKSPSYLNAGYSPDGLFWDGRATDAFRDPLSNVILLPTSASLESQSAGPPVSSAEMAHSGRDWSQVAARVQNSTPLALAQNIPVPLKAWINGRTYAELFSEAFGSPDITPARIAMAVATHERTLFSDQTPFDRDLYGIPSLTPQETNGRNTFVTLQCTTCHDGALLSNQRFENIGVRPQADDPGRGGFTGVADDIGRFKTPSLRNVELRAPFMHNGRFASIEDVIEFYNRGGDFDAPNIDHGIIHPLNLTAQQKADIAAFLKRPMTDLRVKNELPPFDRPQLFSESDRVPQISGTGRSGTGGVVPEVVAISPPLLGNPNFNVSVKGGATGAQAYLSIGLQDPGVGSSLPSEGAFAYRSITLGTGADAGFGSVNIAIPNLSSMIGRTYYGRWYVVDAAAENGFSVSKLLSFKIFSPETSKIAPVNADFDGDGRTDISTFRNADLTWYVSKSGGGNAFTSFGLSSDKLVPADHDGDGRTDISVFRDGVWYTLLSSGGFSAFSFGMAGDIPQPADFDGDGKADFAVFRPSDGTWYVMGTTAGFSAVKFGTNGDRPLTGDFDGDGKADQGVYRDGVWYLNRSTAGFYAVAFGLPGDKPVVGDYDGDGKSDIAVWRPSDGIWYYLRSSDGGFGGVQFGISTDVPVPGDYDGDGKADFAVFRSGTWYILGSTSGFSASAWGLPDDRAVPAAFVP